MKKLNIPLIIGLIIVLGITFLIFFGEYLAPHDASVGEQEVWVMKESGERELLRAPFAPSKKHFLGTDNGGRDVLSVLMAGAKNTFTIVLLATLLRFLIALPIAFFSAFGERFSKRLIVICSSTFSAVPSLLICIMILKISTISNLDLASSLMAFIIVFTIVGWGRLANTIEEKIKDILNMDFIQGEIAIGKSKFAIATKNVMAHLMPSIVIYVFLEIALVLLLLAQLGIFEVFVGNKSVFVMRTLGDMTRTNFNFFPEWGAMLASTKQSIIGNKFWLSIFPLTAFSISIIGFNLLGQGLNYELNKRNSRFISYVNKLWFHLSPKTFIGEVKNFKTKRKVVVVKFTALALIALMIIIPILNTVVIVDKGVMAHVNELARDEYEGRLIGTLGHQMAAEYIVSQLKNYNIDPLFNGSYISEFNVDPTYNIINASEFIISNSDGERLDEFKYKVDYYFEGWASNQIESIEGEILTVDDFLAANYDVSKEYILVLSPKESQSGIYDDIVSQRQNYKFIKGVVVPNIKQVSFLSKRMEIDKKVLARIFDNVEAFRDGIPPIKIIAGTRATRRLWQLSGDVVTVKATIDNPEGLVGRNIGGIIEGKNKENPIIIATSYDYLGFHDTGVNTKVEDIVKYKGLFENGTSIAGSLELARNLGDIFAKPERSIIFLFIDGSKVTVEGMTDLERYAFTGEEPLMIFLNYMGVTRWHREEDSLYHHTIINSTDSKMEGEFYRWMRRNSAKSDYYMISDNFIRANNLLNLRNVDMVGIVLQGLKENEKSWHIGMEQSNLGEIDVERLRTHIQYLLDSISDMAYGRRWFN